jgi:hypothetical protein
VVASVAHTLLCRESMPIEHGEYGTKCYTVNIVRPHGLFTTLLGKGIGGLKERLMSEEDYAKDPIRNRLAVLLSRTNHLSYHLGQITLALK